MRALTSVAAGALAVALVLSGCSGRPGAAAVVDGTTISSADVDTVTTELLPIIGAGATPAAVLTDLLRVPTVLAEGKSLGIAVSPEDATAFLNATAAEKKLAPREYSAPVLRVATFYVTLDKIRARPDADAVFARLTDALTRVHVTVSPRYGTVDPKTLAITASTPDWIVAPRAS